MTRFSTPDPALASTLRRMREERGINRETLAVSSGIATASLVRIELARTAPRWDTVRRLAGALDVSLVELSAAVEATRMAAASTPP